MKEIQELLKNLSKMQQIDLLLELLGCLTTSEEENKELAEMDTLREEIEKSFVRPNEISIDKVSRFNELVRKHFPPDNLDRI